MQEMTREFFEGITEETIISLSALNSFTPYTWLRVRKSFKTLKDFLEASDQVLSKAGFTTTQINSKNHLSIYNGSQMRLMERFSIKIVKLGEKNYPKLLAEIPDPPLWLFWRGNLEILNKPALTVVGSRKVTRYAREGLEKILTKAIVRELCLISGLAYGVDKLAHELSLAYGGVTGAVMAGGLDSIYPLEHYQLAEKIIEQGGVLLSEYPPLTRPKPYYFPVRNRIIAGLSKATFVVQASQKSGTLTTARSALDYNRDVLVLPAPFNDQRFKGNNFLIKHGAQLIDESSDLASYFQLDIQEALSVAIDKSHRQIIDFLKDGPLSIDQLCLLCDRPIEQVLASIAQLEIEGLIFQNELGEFQRKNETSFNC